MRAQMDRPTQNLCPHRMERLLSFGIKPAPMELYHM
eukprot:gene8449-17795_t